MKKIITLLTISILLLLSGCSSANTDAKSSGYQLQGSFNGGNDALTFGFEAGMPPEKIKDNGIGTFDIRLLIENLGETDIPKDSIHVSLTGFDLAQFNVAQKSKSVGVDLRGYKKQGDNVIQGGKQFVMFNSLQFKDSIVSGTRDEVISANICYPYETRAVAVMCVGGNTLIGYDNKYQNCDIEGDRQYANSGAPVQIENVKQYSAGESKILFQFDIVHKPASDLGSIYEAGSFDNDCKVNGNTLGSVNAKQSENKVTYVVDTGINGINCEGTNSNTNTVMLADTGKYTVSCEQDTTGLGEAYEKLARITLDYEYVDRVSQTVKIEHIEK